MRESLFGTDGARGKVNSYPIRADVILKLGMAAGLYFQRKLEQYATAEHSHAKQQLRVVIAKDTRLSGYMIEQALTSGLIAMGLDVILVGPMPTAAVPLLVRSLRADFGIMITASHNPHYDNGIKLFDSHGLKMGDNDQHEIQLLVDYCTEALRSDDCSTLFVKPEELGKARRLEDAIGRYMEYIKGAFGRERNLAGFRVVVDCANGAAYKVAPSVFWELGAEVISIHHEPDGLNINENCGSTAPESLSDKVTECNADIGFAFDGDADRVVVCDENGRIIHGDLVIALLATHLAETKKLRGGCIVVAQDSNSALTEYMATLNVKTILTKTGDRYVSEEMRRTGSNLGGERSGHIILGDYVYTGDGILSALHVMNAIAERKQVASSAFELFQPNPCILDYVSFANGKTLSNDDIHAIMDVIVPDYPQLKIITRKSGTENKIRILVEGKDKERVSHVMDKLKGMLEAAIGQYS